MKGTQGLLTNYFLSITKKQCSSQFTVGAEDCLREKPAGVSHFHAEEMIVVCSEDTIETNVWCPLPLYLQPIPFRLPHSGKGKQSLY